MVVCSALSLTFRIQRRLIVTRAIFCGKYRGETCWPWRAINLPLMAPVCYCICDGAARALRVLSSVNLGMRTQAFRICIKSPNRCTSYGRSTALTGRPLPQRYCSLVTCQIWQPALLCIYTAFQRHLFSYFIAFCFSPFLHSNSNLCHFLIAVK